MELNDCVAVVTGGATGIGRALVERFHKEGASGLVVADLNIDGAKAVSYTHLTLPTIYSV